MTDRKGVVIVGELSAGNLAPITTELLGIGRKLASELWQELSFDWWNSRRGSNHNM